MKITDVKAYPLKTRTALVRVFTDEGLEGIGECSPMNVAVMCHFVTTVLRPLVLGKNPLDVERLWDAMYFGTYKLGTEGTQPSAISGVDIALWDIKARAAGLPLYQQLGGAVRTTFTMYKSIGGGGDMTVDQMVAEVRKAHEQGFKAVKIRMDWRYQQDVDPAKDLEMFRRCRELPPGLDPAELRREQRLLGLHRDPPGPQARGARRLSLRGAGVAHELRRDPRGGGRARRAGLGRRARVHALAVP